MCPPPPPPPPPTEEGGPSPTRSPSPAAQPVVEEVTEKPPETVQREDAGGFGLRPCYTSPLLVLRRFLATNCACNSVFFSVRSISSFNIGQKSCDSLNFSLYCLLHVSLFSYFINLYVFITFLYLHLCTYYLFVILFMINNGVHSALWRINEELLERKLAAPV
jgi:hypothetical protein